MTEIAARPLVGLERIVTGDPLGARLADALARTPGRLADGDVLVISHKVVSKAEGRTVHLADVRPGPRANAIAERSGRDPRHVQVVLDESAEVLREGDGPLICRTRHGFVCANAGVDASNSGGEDLLVLLPVDPDRSARRIRAQLAARFGVRAAVVISDSFGRAWRVGQCEVAIGIAGLAPLDDWRGRQDTDGRLLRATHIAIADQAAAAADLARTKDGLQAAVRVRGLRAHVTTEDGPGAAALIRPADRDLFS